LLAKAVGQATSSKLSHRIRQQAGSYRLNPMRRALWSRTVNPRIPNAERRTANPEPRITINDEPARIRPTFFIGRQSAEHHPTALPKPDADFTVLAATCFENDLVAGLKKRTHLAVGQRDGVFSAIGHFQQAAELAWLRA
jgi:hypothetical protein